MQCPEEIPDRGANAAGQGQSGWSTVCLNSANRRLMTPPTHLLKQTGSQGGFSRSGVQLRVNEKELTGKASPAHTCNPLWGRGAN